MKTTKGQVAWLSARTQRVFGNFEDALEDAKHHIFILTNKDDIKSAYNDVYIVHLWLKEK